MPTKHLKNLLTHTSVQSRFPAIQQFSPAGVFTSSSGRDAGSQIQSQLQVLTGSVSGGPGSDVAEQVATLSKHLNDLKLAQQVSLDSLNRNTQALVQNTVTKASGSSSSSTAGGLLSQIIGSTFAFSPIVKGLFRLFEGGGSSQTAQPLVPFTLPPSIQYQGAYSSTNRGQVTGVDYGQNGIPKVSSAVPATNIQIQVNAMDSRSFLDHSADIAAAVREAMLHSNSLNDVIADL